ncbi:MAG: helix-turn-helix transcriptional regulator [Clostridia bacterium]|nr:helix-turn-helix transcriptional regulator [Clostridia bacterium]
MKGTDIEKENKTKEFYAVFRMECDRKVVLKAADEKYLELIGCRKDDIGRDLKMLVSTEEYKRISYFMESYQGHPFELKYVRNFGRTINGLWKVRVKINYPEMKCRGRLMEQQDAELCSTEKSDNSKVQKASEYSVIVLSRQGDRFRIELISDNIPERLCCLHYVQYLDEVLKNGETEERIGKLLQNCIESGKEIELYDTLLNTENYGCLFHIAMKPYCANKTKGIIITLSEISCETYERDYQYPDRTEYIFDKYIIGLGVIDCSADGRSFFYDINPYLVRLINEKRITKSALISSFPFRSAVSQKISCFGSMDFTTQGEVRLKYIIGAVPVIQSGLVEKIMLYVIPTEKHEMIDSSHFERLTPREGNVVRLALEGMDNKYIGKVLNISEGTVKRELFSSYQKLDVNTKIEALLKLYHLG